MGLTSVLVDRGRILRSAAQPLKVEGRTQFVDVEPGSWFDCRLFMPASPESYDPSSVRRKVVRVPTLMYDTEDEEGNEVTLLVSDRVEVESDDLGSDTWQVTGAPEPLRKKEGIIGFQVTLRLVESVEFEPKI